MQLFFIPLSNVSSVNSTQSYQRTNISSLVVLLAKNIVLYRYNELTQPGTASMLQDSKFMFEFYERQIEEHRQDFDENNMRDLVDLYLEDEKKPESERAFTSEAPPVTVDKP